MGGGNEGKGDPPVTELAGYDDVPTSPTGDAAGRASAEAPAARPLRTPPPSSSLAARSTLVSPAIELRSRETLRIRKLAWAIVAVCTLVLAFLPMVELPPFFQIALGVAMVVDVAVALWFRRLNDRPEQVTEGRMLAPWLIMVATNQVVMVSFGIVSAAAMIVPLTVGYVTQRYAPKLSLTVFLASTLLHGGTVAVFASGLARDPGMIPVHDLSLRQLVFGEILILALFTMGYAIARVSRRATLAGLEELQRATHAAAQREALLVEAREELERALRPGGPGRFSDQVLGSFRLGEILGRGAMGEVYAAERTGGGAREAAAVKLLRIDALAQPGLLARFLREARAIAALDSPHVVRVIETGDETAPLPYIAMERLAGHDLAYVLRARARLPVSEVVDLVRQVARGVDAAHAVGIVHRDLKPQNLFLHQPAGSGGGTWKVLDFGVSKLAGEGNTLSDGHIVGTPAYMAPEQVRGEAVDERTDVYALAVVAYRCLTGELPFRGRDTAELLYQVAHAPVPVASQVAPGLPPALDEVLARGLHRQPARRFASAGALADALAAALAPSSGRAAGASASPDSRPARRR